MRRISADDLRSIAARLLVAAGVGADEASIVSESLVDANLCGHDSHGVMRIAEYVDQLGTGTLKPAAEFRVLRETAAIIAADANFGFGQVQMLRLIEHLTPKARTQGVASGSFVNCGHVGRLGEWVERIARAGLAALVTVNDNGVLKCVAPPGGIEPRISTNPLAIGVPTSGEPLVLDISTSAVANGKLAVARLEGKQVPAGWLQDADGHPTSDPHSRLTDPPGTILPMGGEQGYKGFGLGLLLDVLVGGLSGGFCPPAHESAHMTNNVLLVMWDPAYFAGGQHFTGEADKLMDYVRQSRRKPGVDAIRLPGDRSNALREERSRDGIPLDDGTWRSLQAVATALQTDFPAT